MDEIDEKYAEEQFREQQTVQRLKNTGSGIDSLTSGLANRIESKKEREEREEREKKDKDSINDRGTNESGRTSNDDDDDSDDDSSDGKKKDKSDENSDGTKKDKNKKDELGEKDGLDDKKDDKSKKDKEGKEGKEDKKGKNLKDKAEDSKGNFLTKKINRIKTKIKIYLIGIGVVLGLFLFAIIAAYFIYAFDVAIGSISSFFGVSEDDTEEGLSVEDADGLLTDEQYMINPSNGEPYSTEEIVDYLKSDGGCKTTTMATIMDWFDSWDGAYANYCGYYRFMQRHIKELEEDYDGVELDRGLVVSSLFYGFANQIDYYDYNKDVDVENKDDLISPYNRYESLEGIIKERGVLTKEDLKQMIDYSLLDESHTYYSWEVEEKTNNRGEVVKKVGKCNSNDVERARYSSYKWSIFMRFGVLAADTYQKDLQYGYAFNSSDDECKMGMTDEELKARIIGSGDSSVKVEIDNSVRKANKKFEERRYAPDLTPFSQKADPETSSADIFSPYEDMDLNYMNGFAYVRFPAFKRAIENSEIDLSYDYITTPKQIEEIIEEVITKKADVNYYLGFRDMDTNEYTMLGDYVIGANCEEFLTAAPDAISVRITDCDGSYITTTTFKDYIMGVAYGEVSDSGENYVLSEMLAAISYSLRRRNNYLKGNTISMRSGNCDQVYCPMSTGCHGRSANISCGSKNCTSYYPGAGWHGVASQSLQSKYSGYYETAKNYLIVSDNKPHNAHYVSSIQKGWKRKANSGMAFTQIIQEEYADEGAQVVQCNGSTENGGVVESPTAYKIKMGSKLCGLTYTSGRDMSTYSLNRRVSY